VSRAYRTLSVCADDFGLTPAISRGIAALAQDGRLTAVSCMISAEHWPASATMLADLPHTVDRGLHFNLTDGEPLSAELRRHWPRFPALASLIAAAHLGRLPLLAIEREWQAQWQHFVDATGATPGFVDGHQHVHHLPGVRDIVLEAASAQTGIAVRNTGHVIGPGNALKRLLIERTGGVELQRRLVQLGIPHNRTLVGAYDFQDSDYGARMRRWLAALPLEGALLFCHPAMDATGATVADAIAPARLREAAYLSNAAFAEDMDAAGVTLGSAWRRGSPRAS
jgi:predicted glycoside hydrolase/deacetylase ChbG (UPF0249 family)